MKNIYKGVVEGNVIYLEQQIDLPVGTHILVSLQALYNEEQDAIKKRQLSFLERGFDLGEKMYAAREDLYDRNSH